MFNCFTIRMRVVNQKERVLPISYTEKFTLYLSFFLARGKVIQVENKLFYASATAPIKIRQS